MSTILQARHFRDAAAFVARMLPSQRHDAARLLAAWFAQANPRFDAARFTAACGVEPEDPSPPGRGTGCTVCGRPAWGVLASVFSSEREPVCIEHARGFGRWVDGAETNRDEGYVAMQLSCDPGWPWRTCLHWPNPWPEAVPVPLERLAECHAGLGQTYLEADGARVVLTVERVLAHWRGERPHARLDAYILPQPDGWHSIGVRYGARPSAYLSPPADRERTARLLAEVRGTAEPSHGDATTEPPRCRDCGHQ